MNALIDDGVDAGATVVAAGEEAWRVRGSRSGHPSGNR